MTLRVKCKPSDERATAIGYAARHGLEETVAALIETFDAVLPGAPAERRLMFGYPAAFVNGNMFMGLYQEQLILRLDDESRHELLDGGAALFEPMKGRPMKQYVVAPAALVGDRATLGRWVRKAFAYGKSLPPKAKKPTKKKPAAKKKAPRKMPVA